MVVLPFEIFRIYFKRIYWLVVREILWKNSAALHHFHITVCRAEILFVDKRLILAHVCAYRLKIGFEFFVFKIVLVFEYYRMRILFCSFRKPSGALCQRRY